MGISVSGLQDELNKLQKEKQELLKRNVELSNLIILMQQTIEPHELDDK